MFMFFTTPSNGIEFYNKQTHKYLGIYHIHLSNIDKSVLLWYFKYNENGIFVHFEYIIHPNDDYKQILKDIYNRNDDGFNFSENCYFMEKHLKENIFIKTFEDFNKI